jgi:hydrogenase maturation protease
MTTDRVLVIGYGNTLRGDDGVGVHVGDALRDDPRLAGARIITCPQLTPELAEDISAADLVVLVDARVDHTRPGAVRVDTIVPGAEPCPSGSHVVDANDLIELARSAFGAVPKVVVVSAGGTQFGFGEGLSDEVSAAVPVVSDVVVGLIEGPWSLDAIVDASLASNDDAR